MRRNPFMACHFFFLLPPQTTQGTLNSTPRQAIRVKSSTLEGSNSRPFAWRNTLQRLGLAAADIEFPKGYETCFQHPVKLTHPIHLWGWYKPQTVSGAAPPSDLARVTVDRHTPSHIHKLHDAWDSDQQLLRSPCVHAYPKIFTVHQRKLLSRKVSCIVVCILYWSCMKSCGSNFCTEDRSYIGSCRSYIGSCRSYMLLAGPLLLIIGIPKCRARTCRQWRWRGWWHPWYKKLKAPRVSKTRQKLSRLTKDCALNVHPVVQAVFLHQSHTLESLAPRSRGESAQHRKRNSYNQPYSLVGLKRKLWFSGNTGMPLMADEASRLQNHTQKSGLWSNATFGSKFICNLLMQPQMADEIFVSKN
jgi:hypothetical protein